MGTGLDTASVVVVNDAGICTDLQTHTELREALLLLTAGALLKVAQQAGVRSRRQEGQASGAWHGPWSWPGRKRPAAGRSWHGGAQSAADTLLAQGKEHSKRLRLREAVACFEEADAAVPGSADTLCMCAKGASDCCYLDEVPGLEQITTRDKQAFNQRGIDYAEAAIKLAPTAALPHVAACISMGRLAVFSDNKAKVRLAGRARVHAEQALQLDPNSDLAHHLMGQWNYQMAQLPGIVRYLVRLCYGEDLAPGSHAAALSHFTRAAELDPTRLIHRVEIGRTYRRLGRREDAAAAWEAALALECEDVNAWLQRKDAEGLLAELERLQDSG